MNADEVIEKLNAIADSDVADTAKILAGLHGLSIALVAISQMIGVIGQKIDRIESVKAEET